MKKIGYVFHGPKTPSLKKQTDLLLEVGCKKSELWIDTQARLRPERRDMIEIDVREGEGDIVFICTPAIIGSGKVDTAKAVLAIGAKGAAVQVVGKDPIIYVDQALADNFAVEAVKISRQANALENVMAGRVGRKEKWAMDKDTEHLIRIFWHDMRVPMARIIEAVHFLGGITMTRENLYSRLGPREVQQKEG